MTSIGIDFGTTNSVAANYSADVVEVIPIGEPPSEWVAMGFDSVLPSVVALDEDRVMHFGWQAKTMATDKKFEAIKRLFKAEEIATAGGEDFLVEEVAAAIFRHIRQRILATGLDFSSAVITVPANSRGLARYRTRVCAGIGGIEPLGLINEPTAAAMAYSRRQIGEEQNVLVLDFGGGTLDVTLLDTRDGMFFEQASAGIPRLGGIDFDNAIFQDLIQHVPGAEQWTTADKNRVRLDIEMAKIALSSADEHTIINELIPGGFRLTRPRLNELIRPLIERSGPPIERVLNDVRMGPGDVDVLLLVGGTTNVPAVRQFVSEIVGREPATGVDPMTAIAEGAAIAAAILTGEETDSDFVVSTEHSLGTVTLNPSEGRLEFAPIIPRNQKLPAKQTETFFPIFDDQESVRVQVIEGDETQPVEHPDNVILTEFDVPIDPPRPASEAGFDVTYTYDADGLLHVDVIDAMTGATVTDRVTVTFKGARDPKDLVSIAGRVRSAVDDSTPTAPTTAASQTEDPRTTELVNRARSKVMPFVDDAEAAVISELVDQTLEASSEELTHAQGALEEELRKYSFLW
ncbi:MAG: Hsp70 family protein [Acidobacteria bacterium]|nr:MAG: Hsp70 family protein [Acidobacteriota bacterium]